MIITVTDFDIPFVYLTVNAAVQELASMLGIPCVTYKKQDFFARNMARYGEACIFIVEAAYLEHGRFSVGEIRGFYPKAKIIVLGSDTFFHISRGTRQFQGLEETDLFLDLMGECAETYSKFTVTDTWCWSSTKSLNDYLVKFRGENERLPGKRKKLKRWTIEPEDVIYDFISVLGTHTVNRGYRKAMIEAIQAAGLTFTRGRSMGYSDKNMDLLYLSYLESRITLGTTSHDNGMRSAKGFRDTVGIMLSRPLIYDDHPDTRRDFPYAPKYDYNDFESLIHTGLDLMSSPIKYAECIQKQQKWAVENTIELQFQRLFHKHGVIDANQI